MYIDEDFSVGDKVVVTLLSCGVGYGDYAHASGLSLTGTIVHIEKPLYSIDFDVDIYGHDCSGYARNYHGWVVRNDGKMYIVKKYATNVEMPCSFDQIFSNTHKVITGGNICRFGTFMSAKGSL